MLFRSRELSVVEAVGALRLVVVRAEQSASVDGLPGRAMLGCLGRQSQASEIQRADKGARPLECSARVTLAYERLQCPKKHLSTDRGERVGGVSGRPTQEGTWSDPGDRLRPSLRWKAP